MPHFNATYEVITPESAEHSDSAERGFAAEDVPLREALRACGYTPFYQGGFENSGLWFSTIDPDRDYRTGAETYYAIHPPDTITPASSGRLARLLTGRTARR